MAHHATNCFWRNIIVMERDAEGYIVSKLPETAVYLKGLENLVIPFEGGFPEYTPEAYNHVNRYFRNLRIKFDIDNLNNEEWTHLTSEYEKIELNGICKIAYKKENLTFVENLLTNLKSFSLSDLYQNQMNELTILDICIFTETSEVHIELPYCTIAQMCAL